MGLLARRIYLAVGDMSWEEPMVLLFVQATISISWGRFWRLLIPRSLHVYNLFSGQWCWGFRRWSWRPTHWWWPKQQMCPFLTGSASGLIWELKECFHINFSSFVLAHKSRSCNLVAHRLAALLGPSYVRVLIRLWIVFHLVSMFWWPMLWHQALSNRVSSMLKKSCEHMYVSKSFSRKKIWLKWIKYVANAKYKIII